MNNETKELLEISRNSLQGIMRLSEQMGLLDSRMTSLEDKTAGIETRMQTYEDALRVSRSQADTIRRAIHQRAADVLGIHYKDGIVTDDSIRSDTFYRPGFVSKLYSDARKFSMLGTPYYETARRDYGAVLNYIDGWMPQVGVEGYKSYLDARRRAKQLRD